jgi:DNA-binding CsgD family transcriptional regulator
VLSNNAAAALAVLGRWDEAVEMLDDALHNRTVQESRSPRLTLAEIRLGRGEFDEAQDLVEPFRRDEDSVRHPQFGGPLHACLAELAIERGDAVTARAALDAGIAVARAGEGNVVLLRLCALGLRLEADEGVPEPDRSARLAELVGFPEQDKPELPEAAALRLQCAAEHKRVSRSDTTGDWQAVVAAWTGMRRPYPAAYARWRLADAALWAGDPATALVALHIAGEAARDLSARPLLRRIDELARDPRLTHVQAPLTPRELEVLRLLNTGASNRQIAGALFITERTASVHVSNIMGKLKAGNRTEAAKIGRQRGLVADDR